MSRETHGTMMDCKEFERRVWAEPDCTGARFISHWRACLKCAGLRARVQAFDREVRDGLVVDPPAGLAQRIRHRRALQSARPAGTLWQRLREWLFGRPGWLGAYAALATVLLVVGVLRGGPPPGQAEDQPLAQLVAEHAIDRAYAARVNMAVSRDDIASIFSVFGARLVDDLEGVTFANGCVMEHGIKGAHLVLDTPQGRVTVLVIPHRPSSGTQPLRVAGQTGRIMPYGSGSLAVLGASEAALDPVVQRLRHAVRWL
jgi:hypothetical protein